MSDIPGGSQSPGHYPDLTPGAGPIQSSLSTTGVPDAQDVQDQYQDASTATLQRSSISPAQYQYQQQFAAPYPPRQNPPGQSQINMASSTNMAQSHSPGRGPAFNMSSLGAALPDNQSYGQNFVQQTAQRFSSGPSQAAIAYQLQQNAQFAGQMALGQPHGPVYNMQYPQPYQGKYAHQQSPSMAQQASSSSGQQFISSQNFMTSPPPQQMSSYYFQASQYPPQGQLYATNQQQQYNAQYGTQGNISVEAGLRPSQRSSEREGGQTGSSAPKQSSIQSTAGQTSVLRGPPRKPKQSGHALWVGNLPPGTNVVDLKDHFSRDATNQILSVFLISKSNCAFVNYKTEDSCAAAMTRFHDSRFHGVRLVCRLRRSSVNPVAGVPTGPSATTSTPLAVVEPGPGSEKTTQDFTAGSSLRDGNPGMSATKDKFFIVKSLTIEDLELSVRNGVWATQSHNEEALNKAYAAAENVYLIFSANKSGEYFGYARMTSPINDDPSAAIEFAPKVQTVEDSDLPKAIPTLATEFAPKGRIIDDSARGTIFWEAEFEEAGEVRESEDQHSEHSDQEVDGESPTKAWGKPFSIEWQSTNRLPFYRTRGLRNPWNSNREVKIARDGTELETSIGRRLIQMFYREPSPTAPTMPVVLPPGMGGFSSMRPY